MKWTGAFIEQTLKNVPAGRYRRRAEAELRDHLETQYRALTEAGRTEDEAQAETLCVMGEPEKLKEEYEAAWKRNLPARLEELGRCLGTLVLGLVGMFFVCCAACLLRNWMCDCFLGDLRNTHWCRAWYTVPLAVSLVAGAFYLGRRSRTARHPIALTCVGLCIHWANLVAIHGLFYVTDHHHRPVEDAVTLFLLYHGGSYFCALLLGLLCGLLAVMFVRRAERAQTPREA